MSGELKEPVFWGIAARDAAESRRVSVDLGLRSALLHYGDMSVPGLAGASYVRQIVWPCLALSVDVELPGRRGPVAKARLATAIEALGCKLWLKANPDSSSDQRMGRVGGVRSLPSKGWQFADLGTPQGYISNPRRRPVTRALPEVGGLGFTRGPQRLQNMGLTVLGRQLTDGICRMPAGRSTVGAWLESWPSERKEPTDKVKGQLCLALNPFNPTTREQQAVMTSLVRVDSDEGRRKRLVDLLGKYLDTNTIDVEAELLSRLPPAHAEEIRTAWVFRRLLTSCQRLLRAVASGLTAPGTRKPIDAFLSDGCSPVAEQARSNARAFLERIEGRPHLGHPDAAVFARILQEGNNQNVVAEISGRAKRLITVESGALKRGPAWSDSWLDDHDILDPEAETVVIDDLPPRIGSLIKLLRDCKARQP